MDIRFAVDFMNLRNVFYRSGFCEKALLEQLCLHLSEGILFTFLGVSYRYLNIYFLKSYRNNTAFYFKVRRGGT